MGKHRHEFSGLSYFRNQVSVTWVKGLDVTGYWSLAACCWLPVTGQLPEARSQRPKTLNLEP
jgi:hypothetical protein